MDWPGGVIKEIRGSGVKTVLVRDPDRLLLEERLLEEIQEAGFNVLELKDPVYFRNAWEARFRHSGRKLLVRLGNQSFEDVPFDIYQDALLFDLGLASQFELLDPRVIRGLAREDLVTLKEAYDRQVDHFLGEKGTKEFVLHHVFDVNPVVFNSTAGVLRWLLSLHYRGRKIPDCLLDELVKEIKQVHGVINWPLQEIVSNQEAFYAFLQEQWAVFLEQAAAGSSYTGLPFDDPEVRVFLDNLFAEGYLKPVRFEVRESLPQWVVCGILDDRDTAGERKLEKLVCLLKNNQPGAKSDYRSWQRTALRLAEVRKLLVSMEHFLAPKRLVQIQGLLQAVSDGFNDWYEGKQGTLASLFLVSHPLMVHQIPHYLALQKTPGKKIALVVFDGLSLEQWLTVKGVLYEKLKAIKMEEHLAFALVPTLTSLSRQAIFSGELPYQFGGSLYNNRGEERSWRAFWSRQGLSAGKLALLKGLRGSEEDLARVRQHLHREVLGLVVDQVDRLVHAQQLGPAGMHQDIKLWLELEQGKTIVLLKELLAAGFDLYLASDHGSTYATGCGRPDEGCLVETKGERARLYTQEEIYQQALRSVPCRPWKAIGFPEDLRVLLADGDTAFVNKGEKIMTHGGSSIEEVVVPFIKIVREE
jgi:hypothetical protein